MKDPIALVWAKLATFANGFFLALPNIAAAIGFLVIAWFAAVLARRGVRAAFHREKRPDLGNMMGSLVYGAVLVLALLVAAAIVFPSVKPVDVLGTLGIGSVAIGFAFKDILQNLLAGLLLLVQRPYKRGDQIEVKDFEGTIEHIESRATLIRTYDGRSVVIPNSDLYTSPVVVNTAYPHRRDQYDVGIGYGDDYEAACRLFAETAGTVEGVLADPASEALPWGLDESNLTVRVRWWTKSLRSDQVHTRARVILALHRAAAEAGIDLPYPTRVLLFHDQTEEVDGDRTRQREGWPAGDKPPAPRRNQPRGEEE